MYIKRTRGGSKDHPIYYLQIVHSYRENGKVKHKVIANLGREQDIIKNNAFDSLIKKLNEYSDKFILMEKDKESIEKTYVLGPILAINKIWKRMNLEAILKEVKNIYNIRFDIEKAVKLMVLNRLVQPKSKLSIMKWKNKLYTEEYNNVKLHHLYRSLNILAENKDMLQQDLYDRQLSLFKDKVSLVFYDLTTLYFDSEKDKGSILKKFGYSKDNKTDCVQIMLGLILNEHRIPIGYEIFPGNTYEGHTITKMLTKLKDKYSLEKIIVVGDRGILNSDNLKAISNARYEYIIKAKLGTLSNKLKKEVFSSNGFSNVNSSGTLMIKELVLKDKRLVVCYSKKLAKRQSYQRQILLDKIKVSLEKDNKNSINSKYKKYLTIDKFTISLNNDKIKEQERFDGYFGYYSNNKHLSSLEIFENYRLLYQIEESFRCLKSSLDIRPIYHWTDIRIEGHIMMCFISFYLLRIIMKELFDKSNIKVSAEKLFSELSNIEAIKLSVDKGFYYCRTSITGFSNDILRSLGCKIPSFILNFENKK